jgi:hypothetical protein
MKRLDPLSLSIALLFAAFAAVVQAEQVPATPVPAEPVAAEPIAPSPIGTGAFDDRVLLAKDAEEDEQFKDYRSAVLKRNSRHFARTMRTCIARSPKPVSKTFVLVADITAEGKAAAVAVKPDNEVANCFASGFSSISYPKPPRYPNREGFPVMMKVRVVR